MADKRVGGGGGGGKGGKRPPRQPMYMKKGGHQGATKGPGRPGEGPRAEPGRGAKRPARPSGDRPKAGSSAKGPGEFRQEGRKPRGEFRRDDRPARPARAARPAGEVPPPAPRVPEEPVPEILADDKVMGLNPVQELLSSGSRPVDSLYIDKEKGGKAFETIIRLARQKKVTIKYVPRPTLDGLSGGGRHQGAVAVVAPKGYEDPYDLVDKALAKGTPPILVVLDGIEDPQNLGAIIRTAEGAGADGVIIPEHGAAHLTQAVARASAGALEHVPVAKIPNLAGFLEDLKEKGFWVVGLAGEAKDDYASFDMTVPLAVVLGSEGSGIRPLVRKKCDALVRLPMKGKVGSLNVSVSAGIVLYEALRQRKGPESEKS